MPLSEVISGSLNGLRGESPETLETVQKEAREFADARKSRGYNPAKFALLRDCVLNGSGHPLCKYLLRSDRRAPAASARQSREEQRKLAKAFRKRDIDTLNGAGEGHLIDALKSFSDFKSLKPVTDAVLKASACASPALLTALGMKAEREFPAPEYKALAESLYSRALDCSKGQGAARAAYRLGLLQVWDNKSAAANATLTKVLDDDSKDEYDSRALYWRLKIARSAGDEKQAAELKSRLVSSFPLTLHSLLVEAEGGKLKAPSYMSDEDPLVSFRSRSRPELNSILASVEMLQSMNESKPALDLLEASMDDFKGAEREVRLYTAVLFRRSGDSLRNFQVLTSLFKENASLMSRASLELFYPRFAFDSVTKACGDGLDPYLMLSLIRQESAFNENAHSHAGAIGLMQVMPRTGKLLSRVSRNQLFNPDTNVKVGVKYFSRLMERFDGSVELSLAAYNAGPERVDEWRERYPVKDKMLFVDLVPFRETREYVASIARNYYWYLSLYNKDALEKTPPARAIASKGDGASQPFLLDFLGN